MHPTTKPPRPPAGAASSLGIAVLLLALTACSSEPPGLADIEPATVSIDTLQHLGGPDASGEEVIAWARPGGSPTFDVGPEGLLWLFNPSEGALIVYDEGAAITARHGRIGNGPGEFAWLETITAIEGGAWTWDSENQQLARWSASNGYVGSDRTQVVSEAGNAISPDGTLWYLARRLNEAESERTPLDVMRSPPGTEPEAIERIWVPSVSAGSAWMPSYSPRISRLPGGGSVWTMGYELVLAHSEGGEIGSWILGSLEIPYSERERKPGGRGSIRMGDQIYEAPLMPHKPDVEAIQPVKSDEIWIRTSARRDTLTVRHERVDLEGRHLGAVWLPITWSMIRQVSEDRYWVLSNSRTRGYELLLVRLSF